MKHLKIVGVPEHFNFPWQLALENKEFEKEGINLQWTDIPEGTGKMCQMLRNAETDIAVVLTEGIVKDITQGNPCKIVQVYVKTPLIWGIHVATNSSYETLDDLKNGKVAISRYGSGSQLMAYLNANNQGWDSHTLQFEVVNTLDGAIEALTQGRADYFMWEKFMTKPLVDAKIFRRIGDCPTPWPCFVIAVRNEILDKEPQAIKQILEVINHKTAHFKNINSIENILAEKYQQKLEDIVSWLSITEWDQYTLQQNTLNKIQNQLFDLEIIKKKGTFAEIVKHL